MSEEVEVTRPRFCDVCEWGARSVPALYDAKTKHGPWAYLCEQHYREHGVGLGTGRGQRLVVRCTRCRVRLHPDGTHPDGLQVAARCAHVAAHSRPNLGEHGSEPGHT